MNKILVLAAVAFGLCGLPSHAQYSQSGYGMQSGANSYSSASNTVGNTTYTYGSNGYNATSTQVGSTTYYHDNQGHSGTAQRVGNTVYSYNY